MSHKISHIIWDWNGTLLDDADITIGATIGWLESVGRSGVTPELVRQHSSRDFAKSYSELLGRAVTSQELDEAKDFYWSKYEPAKRDLPLATDAVAALELVKAAGLGQSLLSMAPHDELIELADLHGLTGFFDAVQGFKGGSNSKRDNLRTHLDHLGVAAENTALIGDALDDFEVSTALGVLPVLVATGMYSEERLIETGARVEQSLLGALKGLL
ncbi:HAD hydrolase-like protein (plasmid) [Phaeobacter sp. BS23]|uniref:HAD family hydrolase n=1 Tax=Phaeobacter sp. BS23 TaxID=2907239 RepID=UPI003703F717